MGVDVEFGDAVAVAVEKFEIAEEGDAGEGIERDLGCGLVVDAEHEREGAVASDAAGSGAFIVEAEVAAKAEARPAADEGDLVAGRIGDGRADGA